MGKIEDCFGNSEEAQLYGLAAFEQPILRLTLQEANLGDVSAMVASQHVYMRALAGIVVSPDIIEPDHPNFTYPAIRIQPISSASVTVARSSKRMRQQEEYSISTYDEPQSLLIQHPIIDPDLLEPTVKDMIKTTRGALTLSRSIPIREVMKLLKVERDLHPHGRILHDLSRLAMSNIWAC